MNRLQLAIVFCSFLYSCSPVSKRHLNKAFGLSEKKFQDHTGFILYDPVAKKELYQFNSDKYFTPASNTKIFTFYAALKIIADSIPALKYVSQNDSLIFWGTGDPSFLYKNVFNNNRVFDFLKSAEQQLYFSPSNFQTVHFGPGWAWDDYSDYYSAERSSFPVYGNIFSFLETKHGFQVQPRFFKSQIKVEDTTYKAKVLRELISNQVHYFPGNEMRSRKWDVPFKVDALLIADLLTDTLKKNVSIAEKKISANARTLYSLPVDSLYKVMMQESDNFIAEQLLLICAGILSDTLKPEIAIKYVKTNFLNDLKDKPVWVDGSGLSRYNLFTPRTMVQLWEKIYLLVPRERLFTLLAMGGKTGTLQNWYKTDVPYIFGKTGTLSNNHNLSGYLVTKKGKTLIFAFMNNNYTTTTNEIRKNMGLILSIIRQRY